MIVLLLHLPRLLPFLFGSPRQLVLENLALRQSSGDRRSTLLPVVPRTLLRFGPRIIT